jgi:hypothetical protein
MNTYLYRIVLPLCFISLNILLVIFTLHLIQGIGLVRSGPTKKVLGGIFGGRSQAQREGPGQGMKGSKPPPTSPVPYPSQPSRSYQEGSIGGKNMDRSNTGKRYG